MISRRSPSRSLDFSTMPWFHSFHSLTSLTFSKSSWCKCKNRHWAPTQGSSLMLRIQPIQVCRHQCCRIRLSSCKHTWRCSCAQQIQERPLHLQRFRCRPCWYWCFLHYQMNQLSILSVWLLHLCHRAWLCLYHCAMMECRTLYGHSIATWFCCHLHVLILEHLLYPSVSCCALAWRICHLF